MKQERLIVYEACWKDEKNNTETRDVPRPAVYMLDVL